MKYTKIKNNLLKYKFNNSDTIENNYSQTYQDMFVLTMLDGKKNGYFLEIGSNEPINLSNTYLIEKYFGWNGISIDIKEFDTFKNERTSEYIVQDALTIDYESLFDRYNAPKQIDYLSLDIEPSIQTLQCLQKLPLDKYRFSVITFETDYYANVESVSSIIRNNSAQIFEKYGYVLIAGNISNYGSTNNLNPFEDWWIDPSVIDPTIISLIKQTDDRNKLPSSILFS